MAWAKNGTPDTLTSAGTTMQITDLTAKQFNFFINHSLWNGVADIQDRCRFNNNSNNVYSTRYSNDGGAEALFTSFNYITVSDAYAGDIFSFSFDYSISGQEKLGFGLVCARNTAGAGTAPRRTERYYKFVPSPDADITEIKVYEDRSGSYDTGSNLSALGTD